MNRKKKLRLKQVSLLVLGSIVLFATYFSNKNGNKEIISAQEKIEIKNQLLDSKEEGDVFYNIEYSGLDLAGNRFILKSKKGYNDKLKVDLVIMETVSAIFYFKDNTVLNIRSDSGIYNNKTLDMKFSQNVKAEYEKSELLAGEANYSNSKSLINIAKDVKVKTDDGIMFADELILDIKKKSLDIAAYDNKKVNAEIKLK